MWAINSDGIAENKSTDEDIFCAEWLVDGKKEYAVQKIWYEHKGKFVHCHCDILKEFNHKAKALKYIAEYVKKANEESVEYVGI